MIGNQNITHHSSGHILDHVCMEIPIALFLFVILGITNDILKANETCHSRTDGFFGYTWHNSSNLLRSLFGNPDTRIYDRQDIIEFRKSNGVQLTIYAA